MATSLYQELMYKWAEIDIDSLDTREDNHDIQAKVSNSLGQRNSHRQPPAHENAVVVKIASCCCGHVTVHICSKVPTNWILSIRRYLLWNKNKTAVV